MQNFALQAKFDMTYTTLRSVSMLLAAGLGLGAVGAFAGFAAAAVSVLAVGLFVIGAGERSSERSPLRVWIALMAPLWLYQLCLNLILQIDSRCSSATVAELALAAGQPRGRGRDRFTPRRFLPRSADLRVRAVSADLVCALRDLPDGVGGREPG